jgi:hypothetical protein
MGKRAHWFCFTLILMGFLDWLLTTIGVMFCGAQEANPLLAGLMGSNMLIFSAVKLSAVVIVGFLFYKAETMTSFYGGTGSMAGRFLLSGYMASLIGFTAIVTNNLVAVLGIF